MAEAAELAAELPVWGCREEMAGMEEEAEAEMEVAMQEPFLEEHCQEEPYQEGHLVVDCSLGALVAF